MTNVLLAAIVILLAAILSRLEWSTKAIPPSDHWFNAMWAMYVVMSLGFGLVTIIALKWLAANY